MKKFGSNQLVSWAIMGFMLIFNTQCMMNELEVDETPATQVPGTTSVSTATKGCEECDFYVESHITDGAILGVKPGDVICLKGGNYDRLLFRNINGTRNEPVTIRNCEGVAAIYSTTGYGMKFEYSKDFRLVGTGSDQPFGIKVSAEAGFYITMEKFTTDFEVAYVEVAGTKPNGIGDRSGFAGIGVKTSPYQDCELFTDRTRQAWIMRDVKIHHNWIHDTGGEGLYIGHGFYKGRQEANCPAVTYSHSIRNIQVHDNLIENVGFDGIQIKNADQNVKVYNNVIRNYGMRNHGAHNEGLFIGEGTTGKFFNNIIDTGTGNGMTIQGIGNLDIFNNLFSNSGEHGIYAVHGSQVVRYKTAYFNIFNNTVYNSGMIGFVFHNNDGGPKRFINNIVVKASELHRKSAEVEMSNNIFSNDVPTDLVSSLSGLLSTTVKLDFGKVGVDQGADLSSYGILDDCLGTPRPIGRGYDIGAYEK